MGKLKRLFGVLACLFGLTGPLWAPNNPSRLNIKSQDGTVNTYPYQARFTNGTVTDNNDGTVSVSIAGGSTSAADKQVLFSSNTTIVGNSSFTYNYSSMNANIATIAGSLTYGFYPDPDFLHLKTDSSRSCIGFENTADNSTFEPLTICRLGTGNASEITIGSKSPTGGINSAFEFFPSTNTPFGYFPSLNIGSSLPFATGSGTLYVTGPTTLASPVTINGAGAGQIKLTEGSAGTVSGLASASDLFWGDSSSHTLCYNPNNTSTYTVVGSSASITAGHCAAFSAVGSIVDAGANCGTGGGSATTLISSGIAFGSATNTVTQDTTTFRWDNTNKRMVIGGSNDPVSTLDIEKTGGSGGSNWPRFFFNPNTTGGTNAFFGAEIQGSTSKLCIAVQDANIPVGLNDGSTQCGIEIYPTSVKIGDIYSFTLNNGLTLGQSIGNPGIFYWQTWTRSSDNWETVRIMPYYSLSGQAPAGAYSAGVRVFTNNGANTGDVTQRLSIGYNGRTVVGNLDAESVGNDRLSVISYSTDTYMQVWYTSGSTTPYVVAFSTSGHILTNGSSPSVSSCGTSPSVVGDDNQGTIAVGSGVVTSCTLTFAKTWGTTPVCTISDNSTAITGDISSLSATAMTTNFSASLGSGLVYYRCGCSGTSCL